MRRRSPALNFKIPKRNRIELKSAKPAFVSTTYYKNEFGSRNGNEPAISEKPGSVAPNHFENQGIGPITQLDKKPQERMPSSSPPASSGDGGKRARSGHETSIRVVKVRKSRKIWGVRIECYLIHSVEVCMPSQGLYQL